MTEGQQGEGNSVRRFIGWALIVAGVLWMAFAGVCTVAVMTDPGGTDNSGLTALIIVVGLVCVLAGFGVFRLGRRLARS
jgi:hypothetical protein